MSEAQTPTTTDQAISPASPTAPAEEVAVVHGLEVTRLTQCAHWHSDRDIIAIRHKCCGRYYACISCHEALAQHEPAVWPRNERDAKAILCGNCRGELSIDEYLSCGSTCPTCKAAFNPGCANHYDLYFEMDSTLIFIMTIATITNTLTICPTTTIVTMRTITTATTPIHPKSLTSPISLISLIPYHRLVTLPMGQGLVFLPRRTLKAMGL
ncbi:unnamed protein product [Clonostachys rosea f. rosea IK726]|uniref:Uncharacterized protein n=1 Tax=Clonostachys rosea f. rosea IK726 TaxID=1349383 RepID=A0ACA9TZE3_BIOOC|nr:unnamed protein product [Clonostachys rosea f. rosea IK726]